MSETIEVDSAVIRDSRIAKQETRNMVHGQWSADHDLRREGMAEAVVRIVLSRRAPLITAEDWCKVVGIERRDVEEALARFKAQSVRPVFETPMRPDGRRRGRIEGVRQTGESYKRFRKRPCPFCHVVVAHGKHWLGHMAKYHPGEWEAHLEAELTEKYGPTCPDCGERMGITVRVELHEHVCGQPEAAP